MTDHLKPPVSETVSHGNVSITFPESLKTPLTREWLGSSLQKLTHDLDDNRYKNPKIPKPIREGQEPLNDPDRLAQTLTPPGKYLAENLAETTKQQIETYARERLGAGLPLKFNILLGSFNLLDAQRTPGSIPLILDDLFLRQVGDYLHTLKGYSAGLDLTFSFDTMADQWIYGPILGPDRVASSQARHIEDLTALISSHFPEAEFPRQKISNIPSLDLDTSLAEYMEIERIIRENEDRYFEANPQAHDWQFLHQHIRDQNETIPQYSNERSADFHISQDRFVSQFVSRIDPEGKLGILRATSRQLNQIASELQWRIKAPLLDSPQTEFTHSGWMKPQKVIDLTRRFVARELSHNKMITENHSELTLRPGSPNLHKKFYQRPGLALKLSGIQVPAIPALDMPRVFIGQFREATLEAIHYLTNEQDQHLEIDLDGNKHSVPISFHSTITR